MAAAVRVPRIFKGPLHESNEGEEEEEEKGRHDRAPATTTNWVKRGPYLIDHPPLLVFQAGNLLFTITFATLLAWNTMEEIEVFYLSFFLL